MKCLGCFKEVTTNEVEESDFLVEDEDYEHTCWILEFKCGSQPKVTRPSDFDPEYYHLNKEWSLARPNICEVCVKIVMKDHVTDYGRYGGVN